MNTDERIVLAMAELLRARGYAATGINQLAKAAEAPTGSIYHHFKGGKREVAAAALRQTGAAYARLLPMLLDGHGDLVEGIEAAFTAAGEDMRETGWANMCPIGTVTGEIADTDPELREVATEVFDMWVEAGSRYFESRGLAAADARSLTFSVLTSLEGAFLVGRALRSVEPFRGAGRSVAAYAATLPAGRPFSAQPQAHSGRAAE